MEIINVKTAGDQIGKNSFMEKCNVLTEYNTIIEPCLHTGYIVYTDGFSLRWNVI